MVSRRGDEAQRREKREKVKKLKGKILDTDLHPGAPGLRSAQLDTDFFERECVGSEIIGAQKELV